MIDPQDIDPETGRPYSNYSSPSLDTSFHDGEQDDDATSDFTHIGCTVMRLGERIAEARNAANAELIAEALNAYNPPEDGHDDKGGDK